MDVVRTAGGAEIRTDYFSAIPQPKLMFFTALDITMPSLAEIICDTDAITTVSYGNRVYHDCGFSSVSAEGNALKVALTYESVEETT